MNFGKAIEALKEGKRVCREGWNGKGMWLCMMPDVIIPEGIINGRTKKFIPNGDLNCKKYIVIKDAQGGWQPGWLPSQQDIFSEDWMILDGND